MKVFPRIETPCPKSWSSLAGDDKKRFCEQCGLHVHNLSAMNVSERAAFLSEGAGRKCVAYVAPPGSRTVSARAAAFLYRAAKLPRWIVVPLLALTSLAGCATVKQQPITPAPMEDSKNVRTPENLHDGKSFATVGALIVEERPLWKRILWPW